MERAALLQEESTEREETSRVEGLVAPDGTEGMSLESATEIAAELGVEARYIAEAARSLQLERQLRSGGGLLGAPMSVDVVHSFPASISETDSSEFVDVLRRSTGHEGEVRQLLGAVEWATVGRITKTTVALRGAGNSSEVRVQADASGLAALTWIGTAALGGLAGLLGVSLVQPATTLGALGIVVVGISLGLVGARSIWSRVVHSIQGRALGLLDEVVRWVGG